MTRATGRHRAHFAAIARGEAAAEEERFERAARVSPGERILEGARLARDAVWTPAHLAQVDADADGQMELARRRIAMGLGSHR
jgi:hypothetical protein